MKPHFMPDDAIYIINFSTSILLSRNFNKAYHHASSVCCIKDKNYCLLEFMHNHGIAFDCAQAKDFQISFAFVKFMILVILMLIFSRFGRFISKLRKIKMLRYSLQIRSLLFWRLVSLQLGYADVLLSFTLLHHSNVKCMHFFIINGTGWPFHDIRSVFGWFASCRNVIFFAGWIRYCSISWPFYWVCSSWWKQITSFDKIHLSSNLTNKLLFLSRRSSFLTEAMKKLLVHASRMLSILTDWYDHSIDEQE